MSTKLAVGAIGAVGAVSVVGGLGAVGLGPMGLIGHQDSEHECVELDELADTFDENIVVCEVDSDGDSIRSDDVSEEPTDAVDAADAAVLAEHPPVPTTTSEAARVHAFDEACGNHGMYVSFFAQMGFEPPCALLARAGEEQEQTMTRQERKKATLQLRKECKARAKAGNPCTAEEFAIVDPAPEGQEEVTSMSGTTVEDQTETADDHKAKAKAEAKGKGNNDEAKANANAKNENKGGPKAKKGKK